MKWLRKLFQRKTEPSLAHFFAPESWAEVSNHITATTMHRAVA
jgi:hypothetical protein